MDTEEALSPRDLAIIDQAVENHKAALPVATVVNDNQPGRTAIIEITTEPPTLPVGTRLYAEPKIVELSIETFPRPWRAELDELIAHLGAAIMQSIPKDDQIIMDHVQAAHEIAKIVRRKA